MIIYLHNIYYSLCVIATFIYIYLLYAMFKSLIYIYSISSLSLKYIQNFLGYIARNADTRLRTNTINQPSLALSELEKK